MEDIFTIRVKTRPNNRNVYPSERRYSASTVAGLAWVHIALSSTALVLACLAMIRPTSAGENTIAYNETTEPSANNFTEDADDLNGLLIIAPSLLTAASLAAGVTAILASTYWYIDRNIMWLFLTSVISSAAALTALLMVVAWISSIDNTRMPEFYNDKVPFEDFILVHKSNIVDRNKSHIILQHANEHSTSESYVTNRVLSVNIMIACFLELLWSLLSVKISYKGMRTHYQDDGERPTGCVVVTTVKGNRNLRSKPAPDLIKHYPTTVKRALEQEPDPQVEESGSEYRERMMNFINRCGSFDAESENVTSVRSEAVSTHPEVNTARPIGSRDSTITWGDCNQTIYNQNNLDLGKILTDKIHSSLEIDSETKEPAAPSQPATSKNS